MKKNGSILNNFILKIVQEENASNVQLVTKQNISVLVKLFENTSVSQLIFLRQLMTLRKLVIYL